MYSILLVDDEKTIREYLPRAIPFEEYGFEVKGTAMNGMEAIQKLSTVKPDLILLDVQMPVMDGLKFLSHLKEGEFSDTFVVMLSSYSEFAYAKEAMKYGAQAYLNKPVDQDEIIPLLKEMHNKLDDYNNKMNTKLMRQQVKMLNNLYKGAAIDRVVFQDYTLMTCVLLPCVLDYKDEKPHITMKECLSTVLGEVESYLFSVKGSQYSFLIPPRLLEQFCNSKKVFAEQLLKLFNQNNIECSILFDSYIFHESEKSFKEDYSEHMRTMLTELFFSTKEFMDYAPAQFEISEKLYNECTYFPEIKQHFLSHDKDEMLKAVTKLVAEIKEVHLDIQRIQDIHYRIYYILHDSLALSENQNEDTGILLRPEWLQYPYFISYVKWVEMLTTLVLDGLAFIERRHKMVKMGISKEVIEYVHQHYMEQINLKEIADKFYVNSVYLGRAFQKATGVNFKQYINSIRIAEAKKLLLYTSKRIYEIADAVGYTESKYFIQKFTQEVGKSPTEYRNQM